MVKKTILVTGGAGFIGSHVAKMLDSSGYHPVIFDNLSTGNKTSACYGSFFLGDLASLHDLKKVFEQFPISAVIHFAAFIDVGESVKEPARYYINNVSNTLNLLETMRLFHVDKMIFSSSAAIFGLPVHIPIGVDHPCFPVNPYGETKLMVEKVLRSYSHAYGLHSCSLRYFNAAGSDPEGSLKHMKRKETHLIPKILQSMKQNQLLTIFGTDYPTKDGTCIRDYVHVDDLARAHLLGLEQLFKEAPSSAYNLGIGNGYSVREVIKAAEKVTGLPARVIEGPRREGDPAVLIADPKKAMEELKWQPKYIDLESMIRHAWQAILL